jgi:hypothetical protein
MAVRRIEKKMKNTQDLQASYSAKYRPAVPVNRGIRACKSFTGAILAYAIAGEQGDGLNGP